MTTIKHKFETTLALLEKANACSDGLKTLIDSLPSDYPKNKAINLLHILQSNGIIHFFWAFRALKKDSKVTRRLIFHDILKLLQPIYDKQYPNSNVFSTILKALKTGKGLKEAAAAAYTAANAAIFAVRASDAAYTAAANAAIFAVADAVEAAAAFAVAYAVEAAAEAAYNDAAAYTNAVDAVDAAAFAIADAVEAAAAFAAADAIDAAHNAVDTAANAIVDSVNYVHSAIYANVYNGAAAVDAALDMKVKRRFDDEVVKIIKKYLKWYEST